MNYESLPLSTIGQGTELSDDYLELGGSEAPLLCVCLVMATLPRRKVLTFHFALFCTEFADMKYLGFDVRELLPNIEHNPPIKGEDKLNWIANLLADNFNSTKDIINAVVVTRTEPINV